MNHGPQALQRIALDFQLVNAVFDHFYQRLYLVIGEVLVHGIVLDQLGKALEEGIREIGVRGL